VGEPGARNSSSEKRSAVNATMGKSGKAVDDGGQLGRSRMKSDSATKAAAYRYWEKNQSASGKLTKRLGKTSERYYATSITFNFKPILRISASITSLAKLSGT